MAYADILTYIVPGGLETYDTDSMVGTSIHYRGPTATLTTHRPTVGTDWNGYPVLTTRMFAIIPGSSYSDLFVVTGANVTYAGGLGTPSVEQTFYGIRYRPVQLPLEVHPEFRTGGTYALDATARMCIIGWRAEQDPELRSQYKFRMLDSSGTPGDEIDIATESPNAHEFIQRVEQGVEEFTFYLPIWRKTSIYKGSNEPPKSDIGQKVAPDGTPPTYDGGTAYEWVKSADDAERIDTTSRWRRIEEWEGAIKVFVDIDEVFAL